MTRKEKGMHLRVKGKERDAFNRERRKKRDI